MNTCRLISPIDDDSSSAADATVCTFADALSEALATPLARSPACWAALDMVRAVCCKSVTEDATEVTMAMTRDSKRSARCPNAPRSVASTRFSASMSISDPQARAA